jgi:shikimate dehydrogenase
MKRVGVIGDPVEHSLSPHMHNAAFGERGIDAVYELWPTPLSELRDRVTSLRLPDVLGANVTVPHKQAVMPFLDRVTDSAQRIGAVNTVIPSPEGLVGDNTDAYGFQKSIEEKFGPVRIDSAVVLGSGGASRAVIVALRMMGVESIVIANRTDARAAALAQEFAAEMIPWAEVAEEAFPDAGLLVNATSLGWHDEMPVPITDLRRLPHRAIVVDLTYRETPLLRAAAGRGLRGLDGLGMLIHQGARAFELWTGTEAPVRIMQDAVRAEQARRG